MASVFVLAPTLAVHILSRCDGYSAQSHLAMYYANGKHKEVCLKHGLFFWLKSLSISQHFSFLACIYQFVEKKKLSMCCRLQRSPVWFVIWNFCAKWWTVAKCLRFGVLLQCLKVLVLNQVLRDFTITPTAGGKKEHRKMKVMKATFSNVKLG